MRLAFSAKARSPAMARWRWRAGDGALDGVDLNVDDLEHGLERGLDAGVGGLLGATAFRLVEVGQLIEAADEGGERLCLCARQRNGRLIGDKGGEAGEHLGIEFIGLGEPGGCLSESAGAIGVDGAQRQAELGRHPHQGALIAAGCFADYGDAVLHPGLPEDRGDCRGLIGDTQAAP
jgi:hypothetical protein